MDRRLADSARVVLTFGRYRLNSDLPMRLVAVQAIPARDHFICIGGGAFLYPEEWDGVWTPAVIPELPPGNTV